MHAITAMLCLSCYAVNSFIDPGEFVVMKMLNGCKAPHCGKHQFLA